MILALLLPAACTTVARVERCLAKVLGVQSAAQPIWAPVLAFSLAAHAAGNAKSNGPKRI